MADARDRRGELSRRPVLNGLDYVEVVNSAQTELRAHFLNTKPVSGRVTRARITGGETIAEVAVQDISPTDFSVDGSGRPTLTLRVPAPGDFSLYALTLEHDGVLDPYFESARFSFKAACPSTLDCETPEPTCPPEDAAPVPVDYLAKDFQSFRRALTDFSALRWPAWRERAEADFGMMFLEALSGVADDLSYLQDRVAGEAFLGTASERLSIVRHARLVDYEPRPATGARATLRFTAVQDGQIAAGQLVVAPTPDAGEIPFETGEGLRDTSSYRVRAAWNCLVPYWWDDADRCLPRGATEMWVKGHGLELQPGQLLLIDTAAPSDARKPCGGEVQSNSAPPLRQIVQLDQDPEETADPLFNQKLTRLKWRSEDALGEARDLAATEVAGNLVPATQGRRRVESFAIGRPAASEPIPVAVERTGVAGTTLYCQPLAAGPLTYLVTYVGNRDDPAAAAEPEIRLDQVDVSPPVQWGFRRRLLDAGEFETSFTVEPIAYRRLEPPAPEGMVEYDGSDGATIRFGDGVFGQSPDEGARFRVSFRAGAGSAGNVAPDSITRIPTGSALAAVARAVTNPFSAEGGADAEPNDRVRVLAPQAFRAVQYRAVLADDYEDAAETLPWVERAGTSFRWTGSWLSVFTAVDQVGSTALPDDRRSEVVALLDRYRLAGYESFALAPRYASLDLRVSVCAQADAFRGDVERAVLECLGPVERPDGSTGFFHPDRFTFGVPLERSALEAAIQNAPGVGGVLGLSYRWRGRTAGFEPLPEALSVATDEIVRVENDANRPERGSLQVQISGGK